MRQFIVIARFNEKKTAIRVGVFDSSGPLNAAADARTLRGREVAEQLGCEESQLTWEVEEDFL